MNSSTLATALTTVAGVITGLALGYLATNPLYAMLASAAGLAAWLLIRLDIWRFLYACTLTLLFCATSSQETLLEAGIYARYGCALALALWTYHHHRADAKPLNELAWPARALVIGLWLAAGFGAVSSLWSVSPTTTLFQAGALAVLALLVHSLVTRRWSRLERLPGDLTVAFAVVSSTMALSLAAALYGLTNTLTYSGRLQGLYGNPNMLAMICVLGLPLGWGLYRQSGKHIYLVGLLPIGLALLLSGSRTSSVAVVCGGLWILLRRGWSGLKRLIGVVALLASAAWVLGLEALYRLPLLGPIFERFTGNEGGDLLNGRTLGWAESMQLWLIRPATGYGYSAGTALFQSLRDEGMLAFERNVAHNSYLQWILELGAAGLTPLALILAACGAAILRGETRGLGTGLVWAVVSGLILQLTESAMFGTGQPYPMIFWLAVGACLMWKPDLLQNAQPPHLASPKTVSLPSPTSQPKSLVRP